MIQVNFNDNQVQNALTDLRGRVEHLQPVLNSIGQVLTTDIAFCFREERSPDGINWEALSPKTIAQRRGTAPYQILNDTGRLKGSFTHHATDSFVEITTDTMYAPFHQFGTAKMPARPFFPVQTFPQEWENDVMDVLNSYLTV